ncbi:MAG: hypothetical protein AB7R40_23425 [Nitrospiraceae bacterium]
MAAGFTALTSGKSLPGATSFTTASITPTLGTLVGVCLVSQDGAGSAVNGCGMTWTRLGSILTSIDGDSAMTLFYASAGTPSTGVLTISATSSIYAQAHAVVRPDDLGAINTTLVNTPSVANTPRTVTLNAASDCSGIAVFSAVPWYSFTGWKLDASAGWSETVDVNGTSDAGGINVQTRLSDAADVDVALSDDQTKSSGVFAVEFAAASDSTAPTLSNPVDSSSGSTTGSGSVDTDEGNGTLYWVVTTSATPPSAAQVKAGQDHTGSAAVDSGSQAVSGTGTQNISGGFTGLTPSTAYYAHYMHEDAATNQSSVSSGNGFTTDAAAGSILPMVNALMGAM